ncbi:MAG: response regulator [Deltaproteobacteria bacterium]|nr:response regulator [Deltaproteobacteria bacterium]
MPRILVVDDDPAVRRLVGDILGEAGFEVDQAGDGAEALAAATAAPPDLVVADILMPKLDGWDLVRGLRSRFSTALVPVVLLSCLDDKESRRRGFQLGADDYCTKPFEPTELVARVTKALRASSSYRAEIDQAVRRADLEGKLNRLGLSTVLAMLGMERKTGVLALSNPPDECEIQLRDGEVVAVSMPLDPDVSPEDCIGQILSWQDGSFSFAEQAVSAERQTEKGLTELLLDGARRLDESRRK